MTDLHERAPAQALMEKVASLRGTPDLLELPFGIVKLSRDGVSWLRGVNGELEMARQLSRLGSAWTVLHSIPVGNRGSDIDHLVIGPGGVFPINSKRLLDRNVWVAGQRFLVDGRKRDYLRNAEYEAKRVEAILQSARINLRVIPVVAISGAKHLTVKSTPTWNGRNIGVVTAGQVAKRISRRRAVLVPAQVQQVVALLSQSAAWSSLSTGETSAKDVQTAFREIDRGVTKWNMCVRAVSFLVVVGGAWLLWEVASAFAK